MTDPFAAFLVGVCTGLFLAELVSWSARKTAEWLYKR